MFSRVNSLGWALFEELTSAQMNQLDLNASRAIDGTFGGTYNPSAPININGTLTVTNLNYSLGSITNLTVTGTLDVNVINCNEINVANVLRCNGPSFFNASVNVTSDITLNGAGNDLLMFSGGSINVSSGNLIVQNTGVAQFASEVDFQATCNVDVKEFCDWTFNNSPIFQGGLRAYGTNTFYTSPSFNDGLSMPAGELITYSTTQIWIVRFPFTLGVNPTQISSAFEVDSTGGFCKQVANTTWPTRLWCYPQGLWGKTPVEIIAVEFYARANGLAGVPAGDTQFRLFKVDHFFTAIGSAAVANDPNANNATNHTIAWSGDPIPYDPAVEILGCAFMGYNGGDTLGGSKWYEIKSARVTMRTSARGVY